MIFIFKNYIENGAIWRWYASSRPISNLFVPKRNYQKLCCFEFCLKNHISKPASFYSSSLCSEQTEIENNSQPNYCTWVEITQLRAKLLSEWCLIRVSWSQVENLWRFWFKAGARNFKPVSILYWENFTKDDKILTKMRIFRATLRSSLEIRSPLGNDVA